MPDPLDTLSVTVRSPDSNIEAEFDRRFRVSLRFRPGALQQYSEFTLEHQLVQLSRLAWVAYQREYRAAIEASGRIVNDWDPKRRAYREALMQIETTGTSDGGYVEVTCAGLERWSVRIQPGAISQLPADRLAAEIQSAVANAGAQYEHRAVLLKDEYFRFDLPPHLRSEMDRLRPRSVR
jgi:DNA-binding protein YbaB